MNAQDANPGSSAQFNNLRPTRSQSTTPPATDPDLKEFIWRYCDPVYTCIGRLTGLSDLDTLDYLTGQVILDLWNQRCLLQTCQRPGILLFKVLLQYVFVYLKNQGNTDRICFLRNLLLIDSACYLHIIEPGKRPPKAISPYHFLHKIKRLWKTF